MLSTIVKFLIDPVIVFLILLGAGLLFRSKNRSPKYWKTFFLMAAIWFYCMSTPFVPDGMIYLLEKQYRPLLVQPQDSIALDTRAEEYRGIDIVVLGAGHIMDARIPATSTLEKSSLVRLAEGMRLHRLIPDSRLVFAGHSGGNALSQAEVYLEAATELGADFSNPNHYALLKDPTDTWEESGAYKQLIVSEGDRAMGREVILVTSAKHMPRAMGGFRKRGFNPIASPAFYEVKKRLTEKHPLSVRTSDFIPSAESVGTFKSVIKEYVGHIELYFLKDDGGR